SILGSYKAFLFNQPEIRWSAFTSNGNYTITLDSKNSVRIFLTDSAKLIHHLEFKQNIAQIIVSPGEAFAIICFPDEIATLNISSGKELYRIPAVQFIQFLRNGKYFMGKDKNKHTLIIDNLTGQVVHQSPNPPFLDLSGTSTYLVYGERDSVRLINLAKNKTIFHIPHQQARKAYFNIPETRLFLVNFDNTVEIYETETGTFLGTIDGFSRKIKSLALNPAEHQFAALMDDNRIEIWSPGKSTDMKEAISDPFTLVSPKPGIRIE
ncbi:MAG: hypothetical protein HC830_06225, partial [Bacteroidetes bacterium]|nr:hypothetical protein [Bacteroidota bacterium]